MPSNDVNLNMIEISWDLKIKGSFIQIPLKESKS